MAVKIRLKRLGKFRCRYRIVVVDSRKKRDGKVIEEIGLYRPKEEPSYISVVSDRAQYWLGVGAQPSEAVQQLLEITGDWQKFKGIEGAEGTLKTASPSAARSTSQRGPQGCRQRAEAEAVTGVRRRRPRQGRGAAEPETEAAAEAPLRRRRGGRSRPRRRDPRGRGRRRRG